jgi:GNAT superfamily N-acetyltransferase
MKFREALITDIPQIQTVRNSVKENMLSDPSLVTDSDCIEFLTIRGKGWVCEDEKTIVGFSIADLHDNNIWALFLKPEYEGKGIGKKLHELMLDWYFSMGKPSVWLGTAPRTRAERFYRKMGWRETGMHGKNEIKFEMSAEEWRRFKGMR